MSVRIHQAWQQRFAGKIDLGAWTHRGDPAADDCDAAVVDDFAPVVLRDDSGVQEFDVHPASAQARPAFFSAMPASMNMMT